MKETRLNDLLKWTTPLPWPEDHFEFSVLSTAENASAIEMSAQDYRYAMHAANVLPEVVKALELIITRASDDLPAYMNPAIEKAKAALSLAQTIKEK